MHSLFCTSDCTHLTSSGCVGAVRWGSKHSLNPTESYTPVQAYFRAIGVPYLPHFRHVCARNVRAVFHRYNLKVNKVCAYECYYTSYMDCQQTCNTHSYAQQRMALPFSVPHAAGLCLW